MYGNEDDALKKLYRNICKHPICNPFSKSVGGLKCHVLNRSFQVETYKSFRPGDIVLAKVVSFMLYEKQFSFCHGCVAHDP